MRHLVLDTSLFSATFQQKLLSFLSISCELDDATDGVLIHADNFQALNLLQARYQGQVKCIYIDPPYNTDASEILYKNGYKHSSWLSLMENRLQIGINLLNNKGMQCLTIDDLEYQYIKILLDKTFGYDNYLSTVVIRNNPSGRSTLKGFSINHEYGIFYQKSNQVGSVGRLPHSEKQMERYSLKDEVGYFEWENLRRNGPDSNRYDRPKQYYPLKINKSDLRIEIPKMEWDSITEEWILKEDINEEKYYYIYPIHPNGTEKVWRYSIDNFYREPLRFQAKFVSGNIEIYRKKYINTQGILPRTWWDLPKYSARDNGTRVLAEFFSNTKYFDFPKAPDAVSDSLRILNSDDLTLDYFAGSGTTAHAVINLNREDGGKRKYILVEQGEYFDTVLKPRVAKVIYSEQWKDGKPQADKEKGLNGVSQMVKVLKLESYEDTLNNLALQRKGQGDLFKDLPEKVREDYLLRYMLNIESQGSLLSVEDFQRPFDYQLKIAGDSAGAYQVQTIDLVETFNYLLGAKVIGIDDQRAERGFVVVECQLPHQTGDDLTLIFWRDCSRLDYEGVQKVFDILRINPADSSYRQIYLNGDHTLETVWEGERAGSLKIQSIEAVFLALMFGEARNG